MVDIVIVNWNAGDHIRACIGSLARLQQSEIPFKVILVDNASTDDSLDDIPVGGLDFTLIQNTENAGFAAGCNQGARAGTNPFVLFLNPDTMLQDSSALKLCVDTMTAPTDLNVGICGVQLVDESGHVSMTSTRFPTPSRVLGWIFGADKILPGVFPPQFMVENDHRSDAHVDVVMGAFFFVRRSVFDLLRGFDERFFVYYEEVDFCARALKAGYSTKFLAAASVIHKGHGTTDSIRARRYFLVTRSRIQYGFAHFALPAAWAVAMLTILVEPLIRVAFFAARGNFRSVGETASGAAMVLRNAPEFLHAARGS
jgi:GT2 family glycosyltransferase